LDWDSLLDVKVIHAFTHISYNELPELKIWRGLLRVSARLGITNFGQTKYPLPEVISDSFGSDEQVDSDIPRVEELEQSYAWAIRVIESNIFEKHFTAQILAGYDRFS